MEFSDEQNRQIIGFYALTGSVAETIKRYKGAFGVRLSREVVDTKLVVKGAIFFW